MRWLGFYLWSWYNNTKVIAFHIRNKLNYLCIPIVSLIIYTLLTKTIDPPLILISIMCFLSMTSNPKTILYTLILTALLLVLSRNHINMHNIRINDLQSKFQSYLNEGKHYWTKYASLIFTGHKNVFVINEYKIANKLNVLHLLTVSGFHIGILFYIFRKIIKWFKIPHAKIISLLPLTFYAYLLNFPIPITRALIFISMKVILEKYTKIKKVHILTMTISFIMVIYIKWIFSISFSFTLIATITLYLADFLTKSFKRKIYKAIVTLLLIYFSTIIYSIYINKWVSLTGLFTSLLLTPVITFVYITSLMLCPFKGILNFEYMCLENILNLINKLAVVEQINFISLNLLYIYYIIFVICILFMEQKIFLLKMKSIDLSKRMT